MMDMIVNQAAKFRFMNGGTRGVPDRDPRSAGWGHPPAAQHSQSWKPVHPHAGPRRRRASTPFDARMLVSRSTRTIRDLLEHKCFISAKPDGARTFLRKPDRRADIKRAGSDVTIVATQAMVARALSAAVQLERQASARKSSIRGPCGRR